MSKCSGMHAGLSILEIGRWGLVTLPDTALNAFLRSAGEPEPDTREPTRRRRLGVFTIFNSPLLRSDAEEGTRLTLSCSAVSITGIESRLKKSLSNDVRMLEMVVSLLIAESVLKRSESLNGDDESGRGPFGFPT